MCNKDMKYHDLAEDKFAEAIFWFISDNKDVFWDYCQVSTEYSMSMAMYVGFCCLPAFTEYCVGLGLIEEGDQIRNSQIIQ